VAECCCLSSSDVKRLHPLQLSLRLPRSTTTPLLLFLYRRLTTLTPHSSSPHWLSLRLSALIALAIAITTESGTESGSTAKHTPAQLWDTAHRAFSSYVESDHGGQERLREAAKAIGMLVERIEGIFVTREEASKHWFAGKEWLGLLELWVGLGRRVCLVSNRLDGLLLKFFSAARRCSFYR